MTNTQTPAELAEEIKRLAEDFLHTGQRHFNPSNARGGLHAAIDRLRTMAERAQQRPQRKTRFEMLEERMTRPEYAARYQAACETLQREQDEHGTGAQGLSRSQQADHEIGKWLSAALDDPQACDEFKQDIRNWFDSRPRD